MKIARSFLTLFSTLSLSVFASTELGENTYVKVTFNDDQVVYYNFGECYPYRLNNGKGAIAADAEWYKTTDCQAYSSYDCSGKALLNLIVPAGTPLVNPFDIVERVQVAGHSANCTKLPEIEL